MILVMQHRSLRGPFCRTHLMASLKTMTGKSLVLGWWGVLSFFLGMPFTLISNGVTWVRGRGLAAPVAGNYPQQGPYAPPPGAYPQAPGAYVPPQAPPLPGAPPQVPPRYAPPAETSSPPDGI